jgi:hypothetical protein
MRAVLVPGAAKVTEPLTEDDLRNLIKACAADHDGRSGAVRFDQRNDGTVAVHPHRRDGEIVCSPESIIAALAISDELGTPTPRPGQQFVAELDVIGWRGPRPHVPDQTNHLDRRPRRRRQHTALHRGGTHRRQRRHPRRRHAPARRKLLEAVIAADKPSEQRDLVVWIAMKHGHGLTRQTASRELNALREADLVDCTELAGRPTLWFLPQRVSPVSPRQIGDTPRQVSRKGCRRCRRT